MVTSCAVWQRLTERNGRPMNRVVCYSLSEEDSNFREDWNSPWFSFPDPLDIYRCTYTKGRKYSRQGIAKQRNGTIYWDLIWETDRSHRITSRAKRWSEGSVRYCDAEWKRRDAEPVLVHQIWIEVLKKTMLIRRWWPGLKQWRAAAPKQPAAAQKPQAAWKNRQDSVFTSKQEWHVNRGGRLRIHLTGFYTQISWFLSFL